MNKNKTTLAQRAVAHFKAHDRIPNLGQRIHEGMGPGAVHVFPDGSVGAHWNDGDFTVGDVVE